MGGAIGLVAAAVVAWLWSRRAARLNLGVVLKVTAIFLGLFLFQLLIYGVHELAESGVIEGSQAFHDATEVAGPDGAVGHVISYSLLAAPLLYLLLSRRAGRVAPPPEPRPQQHGDLDPHARGTPGGSPAGFTLASPAGIRWIVCVGMRERRVGGRHDLHEAQQDLLPDQPGIPPSQWS